MYVCLLTGCFSLGWSYLGDGGVHWGRGAGGSVLPQPSPSHSCLSARTATSPAHPTHNPGTYSPQYMYQEWRCMAVSVLSFRTPTVSAGWAIFPGSLSTSCTEIPVEPLPLPTSYRAATSLRSWGQWTSSSHCWRQPEKEKERPSRVSSGYTRCILTCLLALWQSSHILYSTPYIIGSGNFHIIIVCI